MTDMTCNECRQIIAVADLTDWNDMEGVAAHCRTCAACAGVVTEVRDSARRVAELLDGIGPGVPAALVARRAAAEAAIERQRCRRRRYLVYPFGGAAVLALVALAALAGTRRLSPPTEVRNVVLRCLTDEQAATLVMPRLGRDGFITFSRMRMMKLGGPRDAVRDAERLLARFDNARALGPGTSCVLPDAAAEEARAMEQDMLHAEADRARQEVERARQEAERAQLEAERAQLEALTRRDR